MKRHIIIFSTIILVIFGLFYWWGQRNKDRYDWAETYNETSREPYGITVIHDILRGYFPNQSLEDMPKRTAESLPTQGNEKKSNYVFIGDGYQADTVDIDKLLLFVQNGGRAVIAANAVPNYLLTRLNLKPCNEEDDENYGRSFLNTSTRDSAILNFNHTQLVDNRVITYKYFYKNISSHYSWIYIDTLESSQDGCTDGLFELAPIGTMNEKWVNFARINLGDGAIFLHTTPLAFTNLHLLNEPKVAYAAKVFSHMQNGIIYWDNKSRASSEVVNRMNGSNPKIDKNSPLKYILAQPSLRWAWFIFLGLCAVYLILGGKRRQRIIPILEEKTNTSLQFIQTIGLMYFQGSEHVRICNMKIKQFQTFVRERYHLNTRDMTDEFIENVAAKSNVNAADIRKITLFEKRVAYNDITENSMIELHKLLEKFYNNCK